MDLDTFVMKSAHDRTRVIIVTGRAFEATDNLYSEAHNARPTTNADLTRISSD